jgi:hypothetical protein
MREWFEAQLSAGLPALAGSEVSGTLALKQELLNRMLAEWLSQGPSEAAGVKMDLAQLKHFVKAAQVRADAGTVFVEFRVAI